MGLLFFQNGNPVQYFGLILILEHISAGSNMSVLVALYQLIMYLLAEIVCQVHSMGSSTNEHGTNVLLLSYLSSD